MSMIRFGFFAVIFPLSCFASEDGNTNHYRTTLRHIESGGIGYKKGYTTLEIFLAPNTNQWKVIPFLDMRGHIFDNAKWAANAGLGLRTLYGNWIYGINTY